MNEKQNDRLKHFREHLRLSQQEMALKLNVSQPHLSAIEKGTRQVSASILEQISEKFSILNMDWFCHGRGEMLYLRQGQTRQGHAETVKVNPSLYQIAILNEEQTEYKSNNEDKVLSYMGVYGEITLYTVKNSGEIYEKGSILILKPIKTADLIGNRPYLIEKEDNKQYLGIIENNRDFVGMGNNIIQKPDIKQAYQVIKLITDA